MGKPYLKELERLEDTYLAIMQMDISRLKRIISSAIAYPLLVVGSGGSLSAAHFFASLHQRFTGNMSKAVTPLEIIHNVRSSITSRPVSESAICCITAGGSNADINSAFQILAESEPKQLFALCAKRKSRLSRIAEKYKYVDLFDFDLSSGKDGFLATNSLLAFTLISARVYQELYPTGDELPRSLWDLLSYSSAEPFVKNLRRKFQPISNRDNFIVLYDAITQAAAFDLESKFTEAALGSALISDFRNFAHGRHHWLAKRGETSAVIALTTEETISLSQKTLAKIPSNIPVLSLHFSNPQVFASIAALVNVLYLVSLLGEKNGIDPGRPKVPDFGRRIYHLRMHTADDKEQSPATSIPAIQRKIRASIGSDIDETYWNDAYETFIKSLTTATFSAIVFDYDDTLCGVDNRFGDLDKSISEELIRFLEAGIPIGIATGRGQSVRKSLQNSLPEDFWGRIVVGYYNGAECKLLTDCAAPDRSDIPCDELRPIVDILLSSERLRTLAKVTVRKKQLSIEPISTLPIERLHQVISQFLSHHSLSAPKILRSGHSVDMLAPDVSKLNVLRELRQIFLEGKEEPILCIGDQGKWPGNDYELLQEPLSLSADHVSLDRSSCWNIAPAGHRGVQATIGYLANVIIDGHGAKLRLKIYEGKK